MADRRVVSRRTIELTWKCRHCGHINRGRDIRCAQCGSPKDSEETYIMPKDTTIVPSVTDAELLKKANDGPNWSCEYCGSDTRNADGTCASCGGKKDRASFHPEAKNPARYHPEHAAVSEPATQSMHPSPYSRWEKAADDDEEPNVVSLGLMHAEKIRIACILGGIALVVAFIIWLFVPYTTNARITHIEWQHTVDLEQRFLRHGTGWESDMPSGAFNTECETRQRGTKNCNPYDCNPHSESYDCNPHDCSCSEHCTDNGNGFASCSTSCSTCYDTCTRTVYDTCYEQCPVFEEWCSYDYHVWEVIDTKVAGGDSHEEVWPEFHTAGRDDLRVKRRAHYAVTFHGTEKDKTWEYEPDTLDEFQKYLKNAEWVIKVNRAGSVWPQQVADEK